MKIPEHLEQFKHVATMVEMEGMIQLDKRLAKLKANRLVQEHESLRSEMDAMRATLTERLLDQPGDTAE